MAEKKRGFHALEERIHQIEEADRTGERRGEAEQKDAAKREATKQGTIQGEKK